jgi:hypothetical protein
VNRPADSVPLISPSISRAFIVFLAISFLSPIAACVGFSSTAWALILLRTPDFVILLLWLAAAMGFGAAILKLTGAHRRIEGMLRIVVAIAIGLGVMSLLVLALGLCVRLRAPLAWGMLIFGWAAAAWARDMWLRGPIKESATPLYRWMLLLCAAALGLATVAALVPPGFLWGDEPNGYDVLEYHLQVPREWYELGRIVPLQHNVFSFFPFNVEMHYLLAMAFRGGPWSGMYLAQLMHVAFIALTVLAIYALIAERSKPIAIIAATAVATTPWMGLLAPIAYDEGGLLLWGTLAIGLAIRGCEDRRIMCLAGAMAGFACGSKLTAVPEVLLAVPAVLLVLGRFKRDVVIGAVAFLLTGCVIFAPWLIKDIAWVGNPVFPEETALFGRGHWSQTQVERWIRAHHPRPDQQNLAGRAAAGWDQVIYDWRYGYVLLPLGVISGALAWRRREAKALLAILIILAVFWLFFTHLQSRFFTLAIPVAALSIGQIRARTWELVAFSIIVVVTSIAGLGVLFEKMESIDSKANSQLFDLVGNEKLIAFTPLATSTIPSDAEVVLVGDAEAFLYQVPSAQLFYRTVFDVNAKPGESSDAAWQAGDAVSAKTRITVIDAPELRRLTTYWQIPQPSNDVMQMQGPTVQQGSEVR